MRILACLALASCLVAADQASGPTPMPDQGNEAAWPGRGPIRVFQWMKDNRAWFWSRREKDQGAVVFVGDSLTGGWDAKAQAAAFPKFKIANRGIGGDVSRGVLFRLREDVLDLHPTAIVLLIGSNDLSAHANPAGIEENLAAILDQAHESNEKLPVVLCTIAPRDSKESPTKPGALDDTNARIRKLAAAKPNVTLFDLNKVLADAEGKPKEGYFGKDRLHLVADGYTAWGDALRPVLEELVKQ